jgi:hypothetical protein
MFIVAIIAIFVCSIPNFRLYHLFFESDYAKSIEETGCNLNLNELDSEAGRGPRVVCRLGHSQRWQQPNSVYIE